MQEIIRRRLTDRFVGREAVVALFRENLTLEAEDPAKRFLFNVHGDSGVGKTYLLRRLQRLAREHGAAHAYVNEHVYDLLEVMRCVAEQNRCRRERVPRQVRRLPETHGGEAVDRMRRFLLGKFDSHEVRVLLAPVA